MRDWVLAFLREIERLIPPPPKCHHAITRSLYGSDATGWEERLAVQINRNGVFHCFFLWDCDMAAEIHPIRPAEEIKRLLDSPEVGEQLGVNIGQYR